MKSQAFGTHPFPDTYSVVETVTLNMTDFSGGNNKFYQMELHEANGVYRLYSRYGRVGKDGVAEERIPNSLSESTREFESIKRSKVNKGYRVVDMAAVKVGSDVNKTRILSDDVKQANLDQGVHTSTFKLDAGVAKLVKRLYEEAGQATRSQLSGSLSTTEENPLGTLTLSQLDAGKAILKEVNVYLGKNPTSVDTLDPEILRLSNEFYSAIPQRIPLRPKDEEGRQSWMKVYALNRPTILDDKYDLLELLSDVKGMVTGFTSGVEAQYEQMECLITPNAPDSIAFLKAKKYVEETQSNNHNWRLNVKNVWDISVKAQKNGRHRDYLSKIGNVQTLFHGSRNANILGISKKGLLLRPPGAYVTGSMFGNGLYFADQSTKSSQYSTARYGGSSGSNDSYFMYTVDVGLGRIKKYERAQTHLQAAPPGYDSVQGEKGVSLVHNEFIIYDLRQQELKQLIEFTQSYR